MAEELLKDCKKYIVRRVINPSLYWMTEYDKKCYTREKEFEYLLAKDVEKYTGTGKIPVGELIAVKDERGFHRGLVTDIFNRNNDTEYKVLLVENGDFINIEKSKIYFIKNQELRKGKLSIVSIQGIQPAVMEIQCENNFMGGIFQKRVCHNWSPGAFQFVRDLVVKNPCVFVKPVCTNKKIIVGEIYFIREYDGLPICLGQSLCDKGFAALCDVASKLVIEDDVKGGNNIEDKIPDAALFREVQNSELQKKFMNINDDGKKAKDFGDCSSSPLQWLRASQLQRTSSTSSPTISEKRNFKPLHPQSFNSGSDIYSSSWMLKKCQRNTFTPSSCKSFKKGAIPESEQSGCHSSKVNIFRVVQRSIELFDKQKQKEIVCNK